MDEILLERIKNIEYRAKRSKQIARTHPYRGIPHNHELVQNLWTDHNNLVDDLKVYSSAFNELIHVLVQEPRLINSVSGQNWVFEPNQFDAIIHSIDRMLEISENA